MGKVKFVVTVVIVSVVINVELVLVYAICKVFISFSVVKMKPIVAASDIVIYVGV